MELESGYLAPKDEFLSRFKDFCVSLLENPRLAMPLWDPSYSLQVAYRRGGHPPRPRPGEPSELPLLTSPMTSIMETVTSHTLNCMAQVSPWQTGFLSSLSLSSSDTRHLVLTVFFFSLNCSYIFSAFSLMAPLGAHLHFGTLCLALVSSDRISSYCIAYVFMVAPKVVFWPQSLELCRSAFNRWISFAVSLHAPSLLYFLY